MVSFAASLGKEWESGESRAIHRAFVAKMPSRAERAVLQVNESVRMLDPPAAMSTTRIRVIGVRVRLRKSQFTYNHSPSGDSGNMGREAQSWQVAVLRCSMDAVDCNNVVLDGASAERPDEHHAHARRRQRDVTSEAPEAR